MMMWKYVGHALSLLEPSALAVYAEFLSLVERIHTTCAKLRVSDLTLPQRTVRRKWKCGEPDWMGRKGGQLTLMILGHPSLSFSSLVHSVQ